MGIDALTFRNAMARLGAAVNVVTTGTLEDPAGFTASAVCSVTDTPPTVLACLNRSSRVRDRFRVDGAMCINVLAGDQQDISGVFASLWSRQSAFALAIGPR